MTPICPCCRRQCRRSATRKPSLDCIKCESCSSTFFTTAEDSKLDSMPEGTAIFSKANLEMAKKMDGREKVPFACKCPSCENLMLMTQRCRKERPVFHIRCHYCGMNGFANPAYWANLFEEKK